MKKLTKNILIEFDISNKYVIPINKYYLLTVFKSPMKNIMNDIPSITNIEIASKLNYSQPIKPFYNNLDLVLLPKITWNSFSTAFVLLNAPMTYLPSKTFIAN